MPKGKIYKATRRSFKNKKGASEEEILTRQLKRARTDATPDPKQAEESASEGEPLQAEADVRPNRKRSQKTNANACSKAQVGAYLIGLVTSAADDENLKRSMQSLPIRHVNDKNRLMKALTAQLSEWWFELREGFSLLLYGVGSKRQLLQQLGRDVLTDGGVVELNGFSRSASSKQLVAAVATKILCRPVKGMETSDMLAQLAQQPAERCMYVLIHNIDGPALRAAAQQAMLAELAACPCVRLVASVDHVSAPLLWDKPTAARFNWLWHDATTFASYATETIDVPPILSGCMPTSDKRGPTTVLSSLAPSAREVFRVLGEQQLDDPEAEGLPFPTLYRLCRERFLVSSEQALALHLTEFRDHALVRTRQGTDGGELLRIELDDATLKVVLETLDAQA